MAASSHRWQRGRVEDERAREWVAVDDAGQTIARVVRIAGPVHGGWRNYRAVALDEEARVIELRPAPPAGAGWLATIGGQVVGRAAWPLQAVRTVEAALSAA